MLDHPGQIAAIVPCKDEAERIAATLAGLARIPGLTQVVVVDDGSADDTALIAERAGAVVVRHPRNRGKAAALTSGLQALGDAPPQAVLFVDGDLEASAVELAVLIPPVLAGEAEMTIATLPPQASAGGGHGFVVRLARDGIARLTGRTMSQPLSGMRCLSRAAVAAALPLARGWGVEVGLTVDVLRAGLSVREVPCALQHRVSGRDWRGQAHRAAQYRDVWLALRRRSWARPAAGG